MAEVGENVDVVGTLVKPVPCKIVDQTSRMSCSFFLITSSIFWMY